MSERPPLPPSAAAAPPPPPLMQANPRQMSLQAGLTAVDAMDPSAAAVSQSTPTRVGVIVNTDRGSAVSSLAASAITTANTPVANNKRRATDTLESESESPKRSFPDYSKPESDENSVISGDDSEKWEKDEERMMDLITKQNELEDTVAEGLVDDVAEEWDWKLMAEEAIDEEQEDPTQEAGGGEKQYKKVTVRYGKDWTTGKLKEIAKVVNVATSGSKQKLFDRIRDSSNELIEKVDDTTFTWKRELETEGSVPTWVLITGEPAPSIPGIDMSTGAQRGFFGPTNKENVSGAEKLNYLSREEEKIKRPAFAFKPKKRTSQPDPPSAQPDPPDTQPATEPAAPSDNGGPSDVAYNSIPNIRYARPKDFFDTQIRPEFVDKVLVASTNARAAAEGAGAGGTVYKDFVPFNLEEMYKMFGLLFVNGLSPKPALDLWFLCGAENRIYGNDFVGSSLDKFVDGKRIAGLQRWKHLRRFGAFYDFRKCTKEKCKKNPLFKVQPLLDELNHQAKKMWVTGKWVSIDEQTLGFKGRHGMKLRISYKREGDGFQCDAVCDRGYTFSFYFRHGDAPVLGDEFKHLDLSPTARRVVWLAQRLPHDWTRIYMDNLFNSRKLFTALYLAKALAHGVVRTSHRGLPPSVVQKEEKNKAKAELLRGTTKAARLANAPECPDLLAVSVYDTKPVNMLSSACEDVRWVEKRRKIWSEIHEDVRFIGFLRLNFINDYNDNMNSTDIADQLRNVYRLDHWLRNRKWWWAFFIWGLGVGATNAWKLYDVMYNQLKEKGDVIMPPKWSHREFLEELVHDFLWPQQTKTHVELLEEMDDASFASNVSSTKSLSSFGKLNQEDIEGWDFTTVTGQADYLGERKPSTITKDRMAKGYFKHRLDGRRHGRIPALSKAHCQYCYFQWVNDFDEKQKEAWPFMQRNRTSIWRCLVCNVNLCPNCDSEFHGVNMEDTARLLGKL